nr:hypothetical protein [Aliamphritea spongicola]
MQNQFAIGFKYPVTLREAALRSWHIEQAVLQDHRIKLIVSHGQLLAIAGQNAGPAGMA